VSGSVFAKARRLAGALRDGAKDFAEDLAVVERRASKSGKAAAFDQSACVLGLLRLSIALNRGVGSSLGTRAALRALFHVDVWTDDIGPGLSLPHPFNVVIGGGARVGKGCTLLHNTTIEHGSCTVVGDGAFVGVGAVILAGRSVGAGAKLGANSVVTRDVPARATAAGVPAKVLSRCETTRPEEVHHA
jgi:serine acetyltransferase